MNKMIESLLDKNLYSIKNKDIILKQTHISFVIMTDDYVYKIKKPVNFKFLDFSTLEKRKYYCEKEVELNKRLSPDVYLGVLEIKKNKGIYSFNNEGETVDYCVKMIRIPEEKMMIHLIKKNQVHESDINNIADLIASFHKKAETNSNISKYGSIDAVKKNINGNYEYAINYINQTLSAETYRAIKDFTDNFFIKNKSLFEKRMKTGKIKDCHGDHR
ncbi:MAG: aminoglycoside phosphotransferase, partial [Spirochaetia bacterium]|nr:aminoglycoside phosphotransferase [Spirochaetia bacterium]